MKAFTLTLIFLTSKFSLGQKLKDPYEAIPSNSAHESCILTLINDSIAEFRNIRTHMGLDFKSSFRYIKTDTTITIIYDTISKRDIFYKPPYLSKYFNHNRITLTKIKDGFIDSLNSLIYIRRSALPKNPDLFYLIDDKFYRQKRKSPKMNKRLQKKLKLISNDLDNYSFEMATGLKAYQKFGIKHIFGVIVLTRKK